MDRPVCNGWTVAAAVVGLLLGGCRTASDSECAICEPAGYANPQWAGAQPSSWPACGQPECSECPPMYTLPPGYPQAGAPPLSGANQPGPVGTRRPQVVVQQPARDKQQMTDAMAQRQRVLQELSQLRQRNAGLKKQLSDLWKRQQSLEQQPQIGREAPERYKALLAERADAQRRIKELQDQAKRAEDALARMRESNAWLADRLQSLDAEHEKLEKQLANRPDVAETYAALPADREEAQRQMRQLDAQPQEAARRINELEARKRDVQRDLAGSRDKNRALESELADLRATVRDLQDRYTTDSSQHRWHTAQLPAETTQRLNDLARRNPGSFEFDLNEGVSKFDNDLLFDSGKDELRPEARELLGQFAGILNSGSARNLKIMIVGHTDDQRIAKPETRAEHPTNWHLSAHRAIAVEQHLQRSGIDAARIGIAGYGEHQPVVQNDSPADRQRNRRVEIYVLSPNTELAGRTD